jgi:NAD(P)-dependent dehydrogenase (short-subunit alcohol dehydrogenase family)
MKDLAGKTAFVTGAASGIGLGVATRLAQAGVKVMLCDIEEAALEKAVAGLKQTNADVSGVRADVSLKAELQAAAEATLAQYGEVHIVHNNAGVAGGGGYGAWTDAGWGWTIGVNLMAVIWGVEIFGPLIERHGQGGHIVNTASISGFFVREGRHQGGYAMTKYAVVALSEALEQETKGSGIGVSVLCPGPVRTPFFAAGTAAGLTGTSRAEPTGGFSGRIEPEAVGARVVHAIRHDEFYIFTHTDERAVVQARHARIAAAFDRADALARGAAG